MNIMNSTCVWASTPPGWFLNGYWHWRELFSCASVFWSWTGIGCANAEFQKGLGRLGRRVKSCEDGTSRSRMEVIRGPRHSIAQKPTPKFVNLVDPIQHFFSWTKSESKPTLHSSDIIMIDFLFLCAICSMFDTLKQWFDAWVTAMLPL